MGLRNRATAAVAGLVVALGAATSGAYEVREGVKYLTDEDIQISSGEVLTAADWEKIAPLIPGRLRAVHPLGRNAHRGPAEWRLRSL